MPTSKALSVSTPTGSDKANQIHTFFTDDKIALNERYALEHNTILSAASEDQTTTTAAGRHNPGKVACCYIGTTANIAALTGIVTGCIAVDTTLNCLVIYNGTNWTTYPTLLATNTAHCAFSVAASASDTLVANTDKVITFNTELYDYGSNYNITTYRFVVPYTGIYHFDAHVYFGTTLANTMRLALRKNGTTVAFGIQQVIAAGAAQMTNVSKDLLLTATDYIDVIGWGAAAGSTYAIASGVYTYFCGHLISKS